MFMYRRMRIIVCFVYAYYNKQRNAFSPQAFSGALADRFVSNKENSSPIFSHPLSRTGLEMATTRTNVEDYVKKYNVYDIITRVILLLLVRAERNVIILYYYTRIHTRLPRNKHNKT